MHFTREFQWEDNKGREWVERLRESARKEFEDARDEEDSLILYQMVITSRHAMQELKKKMIVKRDQINRNIEQGTFAFQEERRDATDYEKSVIGFDSSLGGKKN